MALLEIFAGKIADTALGKAFGLGEKAISGYFDQKKAEIAAMNDQDRQAATLALEATKAMVEERKAELELQKVEQGNWLTRAQRPLFAAPFIIFEFKVIVWDKVLGLGRTDPLDPKMWGVFMLVVGFYFGGRTIEKSASIIGSVFKGRR